MQDSDEITFCLQHTEDKKNWRLDLVASAPMEMGEFIAALTAYMEDDLNADEYLIPIPSEEEIN